MRNRPCGCQGSYHQVWCCGNFVSLALHFVCSTCTVGCGIPPNTSTMARVPCRFAYQGRHESGRKPLRCGHGVVDVRRKRLDSGRFNPRASPRSQVRNTSQVRVCWSGCLEAPELGSYRGSCKLEIKSKAPVVGDSATFERLQKRCMRVESELQQGVTEHWKIVRANLPWDGDQIRCLLDRCPEQSYTKYDAARPIFAICGLIPWYSHGTFTTPGY